MFNKSTHPVSSVDIDVVDCGIDHATEVSEGDVELTKYPWLGILYYSYDAEGGEARAVTTVALIQAEFVIAPAADIGPMPKTNFRAHSRVLLGEDWLLGGRAVRNYVLHPEYEETWNTVALVQLKTPVRSEHFRPLCPPPERLRNPEFYVIKFKEAPNPEEYKALALHAKIIFFSLAIFQAYASMLRHLSSSDYNDLQKQVIPVTHIPSSLCREFYIRSNLYAKKMRPPHVACAVSLAEARVCVWDAGAALAARDAWGRWQLLGLGVRGPGCGAPARFLDMMSYWPWLEASLAKFKRISISQVSKQKMILRTSRAYQRFGNCDEEEKINLLYREMISLRTDNNQYQFLTYNMSIFENVEFSCLTMELINASASSEMRIKHYCSRFSYGPPCYAFKGSIFEISVYLMFSDTCLFEMFAWGWKKNMTLIDIQDWKWEEGTYYEDFTMTPVEYRGPTYMTEFGYEPLDLSLWVPEYDVWSTTAYDNMTGITTPPSKEYGENDTPPPILANMQPKFDDEAWREKVSSTDSPMLESPMSAKPIINHIISIQN